MATRHRITPEIGAELIEMYTTGTSHEELSKHLKVKHGLSMTRRLVADWMRDQMEARSIASMRAVGPKVELVMGKEVDELLRFKGFCLDTALEIWRNLPEAQKNTAKNAFKFLEAYQKATAQVFVLHGIAEASKAGQTMDEISHKLNEKFDRLTQAVDAISEDPQPEGDK